MRLCVLGFAGYRSFAARSPASQSRPLERLELAPLIILLGKNNSGKSTVGRLLHHVLLALGHGGSDPFPMAVPGNRWRFGENFLDVQYSNKFFNPLDLDLELEGPESGSKQTLKTQLVLRSADDLAPIVSSLQFGMRAIDPDGQRVRGLLPDIPEARDLREAARKLLDASCYLGPVRPAVQRRYGANQTASNVHPFDGDGAVPRMLFDDAELRSAVSGWTKEHLEGWRVEVAQTIDVYSLMARRTGRESNLADCGAGVQQVLPIAALCHYRRLGRGNASFLDVVEQPELHLHDAAHAPLGDLFLEAVKPGRGTVLVETHSESLVLRVRRRVAEGLSPSLVAIYYIEDEGEGSRIRRIALRPNGEVDWWPEGVFSERFTEVKAIRRAQRANGGA